MVKKTKLKYNSCKAFSMFILYFWSFHVTQTHGIPIRHSLKECYKMNRLCFAVLLQHVIQLFLLPDFPGRVVSCCQIVIYSFINIIDYLWELWRLYYTGESFWDCDVMCRKKLQKWCSERHEKFARVYPCAKNCKITNRCNTSFKSVLQ